MSAKELENEEADEYKDSAEYKYIKGQQFSRDRIIDSLMMQQAHLSTIKEGLEYRLLSKQIEQNKIKRENLTDYQAGVLRSIEERNLERARDEKHQQDLENKRYEAYLQQNLEAEFDQYALTFMYWVNMSPTTSSVHG